MVYGFWLEFQDVTLVRHEHINWEPFIKHFFRINLKTGVFKKSQTFIWNVGFFDNLRILKTTKKKYVVYGWPLGK